MTITTQHTPGPWKYGQESIDPEWWIVTLPGGLVVANVNAHANQEANARLIAAAPDLLEILQWITRCVSINGPVNTKAYIISDERMAAAHAAIAKATGEA